MNAADKTVQAAEGIAEALNCLGTFLCAPGLERLGPRAHELLALWEHRFAPALRGIEDHLPLANQEVFHRAMTRIDEEILEGYDPGNLAFFRINIRDLIWSLGIKLPALEPDEEAVCALHGPACPVLAGT